MSTGVPAGACDGGITQCNGTGDGLVCTSATVAGVEVCNGVDDDCDGQTDAADGTLALPPCENQAGVCAGSAKTAGLCQGGDWQACGDADYEKISGWQKDSEQRCDGLDDDCNDLVGTISSQATETRNGADDDCDTYCDETFIQAGTLLVTEIMPNPLGTGNEPYAEWFEVHNPSDTAFALCKGWTVSDNAASHTIVTGVAVPARGYLKFGFSADTNANAGFIPDYTYGATPISSAIQLSNSADNVTLKFSDGTTTTTVDAVAYTSTFPFSDGYSIELSSALIAGPSATAASSNDSSSSWCKAAASPTYGTGGRGTPGGANTCP